MSSTRGELRDGGSHQLEQNARILLGAEATMTKLTKRPSTNLEEEKRRNVRYPRNNESSFLPFVFERFPLACFSSPSFYLLSMLGLGHSGRACGSHRTKRR